MKKIALLMALLMLALSLAACGGKQVDEPKQTTAAVGSENGEASVPEETGVGAEVEGETGSTEATVTNCEHKYEEETVKDANCQEKGTVKYTCSLCQYSYTEDTATTSHEGTGASCTEASICTHCGDVVEEAWGHTDENGVCKNCGISLTGEETTEPVVAEEQ